MGVILSNAILLAKTIKHNKVKSVLQVGRQSLILSKKERFLLFEILKSDFPDVKQSDLYEDYIDSLLKSMGVLKIDAVDNSDYESANIILDLSTKDFHKDLQFSTYDLILDLGTGEHIFDFPSYLSSLFKLLSQEGNLILHLPVTGCNGHGFYQFAPDLFISMSRNVKNIRLKSLFLTNERSFEVRRYLQLFGGTYRSEWNSLKQISALVSFKKESNDVNLSGIFQTDYELAWSQSKKATSILDHAYSVNANIGLENLLNGKEGLWKRRYIKFNYRIDSYGLNQTLRFYIIQLLYRFNLPFQYNCVTIKFTSNPGVFYKLLDLK
jgi:hypothetical protein